MSFQFRACTLDQPLLLAPSLQQWLPEGHLARFIADVTEQLDLSAIYSAYDRQDGRGQAGYHPLLLTRLLLYGYCVGVASSRALERKTYEDVAFRYLAADQHPDHDTIANFRKQHLATLGELFVQALQLCQKAGLVKLGHVAIDGTKMQAHASKHKAMSYGRMGEAEQKLQAEVAALLRHAEEVDEAEERQYGKGQRGDELPPELARRESRLKKIREAKEALEAEAQQKAQEQKAEAEAKIAARQEQEK
jgi:transposase